MSEPKKGDRVRVTFDGTVVNQCRMGWGKEFHVAVAIGGFDFCIPEAATVEVLRPPVKVGDVIETREQLDALPSRTAVVDRYGWVAQRDRHGWSYMGGRVRHTDLPATVLYLPDGAA